MSIFKFFTAKASKRAKSTPEQTSQRAKSTPHQATQSKPQFKPQVLWKDSKYQKSMEVFKKYFQALVFMSIDKETFYNKVSIIGLDGIIWYSPENNFDTFSQDYVTSTLDKAKSIANSYLITKNEAYKNRLIVLYNAIAEILDPNNPISDIEDMGTTIQTLERLFESPNNPLL